MNHHNHHPPMPRGPMPAVFLIPLLLGATALGYTVALAVEVNPHWGLIVPAVVSLNLYFLRRQRQRDEEENRLYEDGSSTTKHPPSDTW